jgi:hypothetical protein
VDNSALNVTIDTLGLKLNVTKAGLWILKGETVFGWESLESFAKMRNRGAHLRLCWKNGTIHKITGNDVYVLYEYLKCHFPEREVKGWKTFVHVG